MEMRYGMDVARMIILVEEQVKSWDQPVEWKYSLCFCTYHHVSNSTSRKFQRFDVECSSKEEGCGKIGGVSPFRPGLIQSHDANPFSFGIEAATVLRSAIQGSMVSTWYQTASIHVRPTIPNGRKSPMVDNFFFHYSLDCRHQQHDRDITWKNWRWTLLEFLKIPLWKQDVIGRLTLSVTCELL
jgi:hypothetical protein